MEAEADQTPEEVVATEDKVVEGVVPQVAAVAEEEALTTMTALLPRLMHPMRRQSMAPSINGAASASIGCGVT